LRKFLRHAADGAPELELPLRDDRMSDRMSPRAGPWLTTLALPLLALQILALLILALILAIPALAQLGGGPPNPEIGARMRGVPQPPFPATAEKLPTPLLRLPRGFHAEVFVSGVPDARSLRVGDKGTVFISNRNRDKVYAVVEQGGRRQTKVIASGLDRPNGLAFHGGTLYIAEGTKISKLERIEDNLDNPGKPAVIYSDFPNHGAHGWKFMAVGPDNKLYINVGAPCNNCEPPDTNGQIRRINLDGTGAEAYVRGVRNSVGFDWHPQTKELWFTDNGRDWLGDNGPEDELNRMPKAGLFYGFPYCHAKGIPDPDIKKKDACKDVTLPVTTMGPHAAVMGIKFYTGSMFPKEYQGVAFIARKGSWNRGQKFGYDVVTVKAGPDGKDA
jgi:glucose/arabinose dehydrogenase